MEHLTVISGSGERIELAFSGTEHFWRIFSDEKLLTQELSPGETQELLGELHFFFPPRYQTRLAALSASDNCKLVSALALLFRQRGAEAFFTSAEKSCSTHHSDGGGGEGKEGPSASEKVFEQTFRQQEQKSFTLSHHPYSDDVIKAAFLYKWSLEYAASLEQELLERCLRIGSGNMASPAPSPAAAAYFFPAPEEIAAAAARGAEARRKICRTPS